MSNSPTLQNVFIGGAARSGTTLLGSMLGSHTGMMATPESQFKFDMAPLFEKQPFLRENILDFIRRHPRFAIWKTEPDWTKVNTSDPRSFISSLINQYGAIHRKSQYSHWIDHTPSNLRHSQYLDSVFPGCYFIHIIRDGRAVMASQFKLDWGSNDPVFASLKWMEAIATGLACESAFPDRTLRVYFEKLVLQPETECERICKFLGVRYEPDMVSGAGYIVPEYTRGQHTLLGKSPDPARIDDWKKTLSRQNIFLFEALTYDLLPMLGYTKQNPGVYPKPKDIAQAWLLFKGAFKYLTINALRKKMRIIRNT